MRGNRTKRPFIPQPRDLHFLRELGTVLRICDRHQMEVVTGIQSATRSKTRLQKLSANQLLSRFYVPSDKGVRKSVYTITKKGAATVGLPPMGIARKANSVVLGDLFVQHQLHINEVYLTLKYQALPEGIQLAGWKPLQERLSPSSPIIPDGYFELLTPDRSVPCFLEVDLETETGRTWSTKIESYLKFAASGEFNQIYKKPQFRTLVVVRSPRRLHIIRKLAETFTDKIFWFTTFELIRQPGFWSAIWFRPVGDQQLKFL